MPLGHVPLTSADQFALKKKVVRKRRKKSKKYT
jgi:hypothetical protein